MSEAHAVLTPAGGSGALADSNAEASSLLKLAWTWPALPGGFLDWESEAHAEIEAG
jgi:hypothetical protein